MAAKSPMYSVACPCGSVKLSISARPVGQSWCHCHSCKTFHQTTPVAFAMFPAEAVKVEKGGECIKALSLADKNFFGAKLKRNFCSGCGFRVYNQPGDLPFRGMPALTVQGLRFEPAFHGFCEDAEAETLSRFKDDGVTKLQNAPEDSGGSGKEYEY